MIFLWSFETTFSVGTFNRSDSESAKLSPTQLNSDLPDVFSNGSTITVSPVGFGACANAAAAAIAQTAKIKIILLTIGFTRKQKIRLGRKRILYLGMMQNHHFKMVTG